MTLRRLLFGLLLIACGFAGGLVLLGRMHAEQQAIAQSGNVQRTAAPAQAAVVPPVTALPDFSRIAERTVPAVVNVSSQQVIRRRVDPLYEFLYGRGNGFGARSVENSLGSGVIVSRDGYILTNNHVVTGDGRASLRDVQITVALSDKREMTAEIVGVDPGTDLAVLKVEANNLPAMPGGDSDRLKVAEGVLAIGNPYQVSETVTLGIVSAVNRTDIDINDFGKFIQTDAAINPGNSGGALINARGELVGINTAIYSQSGPNQGIGFAVASNLARQVMNDLREFGEVRRGTIRSMWLLPLTTYVAHQLGVDTTQGVVVRDTQPGSTAERSGLQRADIIVSFNDTDVIDGRQFLRLVGEAPIGSAARIGVIREGRRLELKVPIEQRREQAAR
jgi:S1-C subfamily serine protease